MSQTKLFIPFCINDYDEIYNYMYDKYSECINENTRNELDDKLAVHFLYWLLAKIDDDYGRFRNYKIIKISKTSILVSFDTGAVYGFFVRMTCVYQSQGLKYDVFENPLVNFIKLLKTQTENIYSDYFEEKGKDLIDEFFAKDDEDDE